MILAAPAISRGAMDSTLDSLDGAHAPDEFVLGDWRIKWRGYQQPSNQLIQYGTWVAMPTTQPAPRHGIYAWVSCTMGGCFSYRAFDLFNTTYAPEVGGVMITDFSTDGEKAAAKRAALKRLIISLKTGCPFGRVYGV